MIRIVTYEDDTHHSIIEDVQEFDPSYRHSGDFDSFTADILKGIIESVQAGRSIKLNSFNKDDKEWVDHSGDYPRNK